MKPTTPFQRLYLFVYREWVWAKQNPAIFAAGLVYRLQGLLAGYLFTSVAVIVLLALFAIPSCRKVHPETFWNEAYQRGYAEKVYLPNGQPAYRWKEGSDNGK